MLAIRQRLFQGFLEGIWSIWELMELKLKLRSLCSCMLELIVCSKLLWDYLDRVLPPRWPQLIWKLLSNPGLTDEQLAAISGLDVNLVRRMLYALHGARLAYFERRIREQDGWIIYHWWGSLSNLGRVILEEARKLLRNLERKLDLERDHVFYRCSQEDKRFLFDVASSVNFRCPYCGSELSYYDNSKLVDVIISKLAQLRSQF